MHVDLWVWSLIDFLLLQIKFGSSTYKTEVCRKSLNPQWNSEWYRFEVSPSALRVGEHYLLEMCFIL